MNVVALRTPAPFGRPAPGPGPAIARVAVFDDMAAAEPVWRELEREKRLATPYQAYDLLAPWQRHVGAAASVTPFIVVGFDADDKPLFLWPFGLRRRWGLRVIEFLGGKHANFNMAVWRRDIAARIAADDLEAVLAQIASRADMLSLVNQPLTWGGTTNPFAALAHQRAANFGFSGALSRDFDALVRAHTNSATRKKMRKKERALASHGTVRFERVSSACDVRRVLDAFFKQKSTRMRMLGLPDVFAAPGVRRFVEAAATEAPPEGEPPIELYALSVNDIIVATMGGIVGGGRFCGMFNSILPGRFAAESPGEQLIVHLVQQCCERGFTTFDLGIGEQRYKALFCEDAEPLFDSYLPLTAYGRMYAAACRLAAAGKRLIKQQPALWSLVGALRRLRARLSPGP